MTLMNMNITAIIVGLSLICLGLLVLVVSIKLFKKCLYSFLPDIIYGVVDTGSLVVFVYIGTILAGLFGAVVSVVISDAITDGIGGAIEGKIDEFLRKRGIDTSRTLKTSSTGKFAGVENVIISATGYTGAGGFELYMYNDDAEKIWKAIFEAGKDYGIKPIGLGARDTLRLEMGYCLYGNDIDDTTSPLEAGLGWITKFTDGNNFIDRDFLEKQKADGLKRRLVGFEMIDRGIPRHNYEIVDNQGNIIGNVTSGTMSPMLKKAIGMGYVPFEMRKPDTEIFIRIRNKDLRAKVVKLPFWKG
jgi:glycine cleavage system T protein